MFRQSLCVYIVIQMHADAVLGILIHRSRRTHSSRESRGVAHLLPRVSLRMFGHPCSQSTTFITTSRNVDEHPYACTHAQLKHWTIYVVRSFAPTHRAPVRSLEAGGRVDAAACPPHTKGCRRAVHISQPGAPSPILMARTINIS